MESIDAILDTPAKRTLWFDIVPLLDEDDQDYCKRKLYLAIPMTRGNLYYYNV